MILRTACLAPSMLVGSVPLVIACAVRPPMASLQRPPDPMTAYCRTTVISACSDVNSNLTAVDKFAALEASNRSIGGTFRFTAADASSSSPVDDVAEGIGELVDVGRRTSGLLGLGLEIGLGGLLSPFGAGAFLLFFLLCSGQFGDERFLARAPNAEQGTYYQPRELETYEAPVDSMPEGDTTAPYPTFVRGAAADHAHRAARPRRDGSQEAPRCRACHGGTTGPRRHRRVAATIASASRSLPQRDDGATAEPRDGPLRAALRRRRSRPAAGLPHLRGAADGRGAARGRDDPSAAPRGSASRRANCSCRRRSAQPYSSGSRSPSTTAPLSATLGAAT